MSPPAARRWIPPAPISIVAWTAPVAGSTRNRSVPRPVTQSDPSSITMRSGASPGSRDNPRDRIGREVDPLERAVTVVDDPGEAAGRDERGGAVPGGSARQDVAGRRIEPQEHLRPVVGHPDRAGGRPDVRGLAAEGRHGPRPFRSPGRSARRAASGRRTRRRRSLRRSHTGRAGRGGRRRPPRRNPPARETVLSSSGTRSRAGRRRRRARTAAAAAACRRRSASPRRPAAPTRRPGRRRCGRIPR